MCNEEKAQNSVLETLTISSQNMKKRFSFSIREQRRNRGRRENKRLPKKLREENVGKRGKRSSKMKANKHLLNMF